MSDIEAKLASAVTDSDAREAISAALLHTYGESIIPAPEIKIALAILSGPSVGWIGVGVLMTDAEFNWEVSKRGHDQRTTAELWRPVKVASDTRPWHFHAFAKRPDCALVLAALRAKAPA